LQPGAEQVIEAVVAGHFSGRLSYHLQL